MILVANVLGVALIAFIVWWFWLYKPESTRAEDSTVHISVSDGIYTPATVSAKAQEPLHLVFHRRDPSPCAEQVVFAQLDISEQLELDKETLVQLNIEKPGIYEFTCQMGMYRGKLIIE